MVRYLKRRNEASETEWRCRIGLNTGPVIGSVVGVQKYVYDIFGPGMNLAARMEQLCGPMEIVLCEDMHPLSKRLGERRAQHGGYSVRQGRFR